jgi:D-serine deaminase-like pyridoxal phosphate-dependent protein
MGQVFSRFVLGAAVVAGVAAAAARIFATSPTTNGDAAGAPTLRHGWDYERVKGLLARHNIALPCMLVDVEAMHRNAARFAAAARRRGKTIRLGTKSVRVPQLILDVLLRHPDEFRGLMCFSVPEAHALLSYARESLRAADFLRLRASGALHTLVAYPTVQESDLALAWRMVVDEGHDLALTVDCAAHVERLDTFWAAEHARRHTATATATADVIVGGGGGSAPAAAATTTTTTTTTTATTATLPLPLPVSVPVPLPPAPRIAVSIDADMSYRPFGGALHLGVSRSPCRSVADVAAMVDAIERAPGQCVRLGGVMGYVRSTMVPE